MDLKIIFVQNGGKISLNVISGCDIMSLIGVICRYSSSNKVLVLKKKKGLSNHTKIINISIESN